MTAAADDEPLAQLTRWERSGGTWRLVREDESGVLLDLLTCSSGDVMAQLRSPSEALRAYVRRHGRDGTPRCAP